MYCLLSLMMTLSFSWVHFLATIHAYRVVTSLLQRLHFITLQAFGDAYKLVAPAEEAGRVLSPYVITNNTGLPVTLKLDSAFEVS